MTLLYTICGKKGKGKKKKCVKKFGGRNAAFQWRAARKDVPLARAFYPSRARRQASKAARLADTESPSFARRTA